MQGSGRQWLPLWWWRSSCLRPVCQQRDGWKTCRRDGGERWQWLSTVCRVWKRINPLVANVFKGYVSGCSARLQRQSTGRRGGTRADGTARSGATQPRLPRQRCVPGLCVDAFVCVCLCMLQVFMLELCPHKSQMSHEKSFSYL